MGVFAARVHLGDRYARACAAIASCLKGQIRPDPAADHAGGQQRGLVALTGADLKFLFRASQPERRDHRGRQRRPVTHGRDRRSLSSLGPRN